MNPAANKGPDVVPPAPIGGSAASSFPAVPMDQLDLKKSRINSLARQPISSLGMMVFMLWMSGNDLHIFSIMITVMAIYQPLKAFGSINAIFTPFASDPQLKGAVLQGKIMFFVFNCVALGVGIGKCAFMGLVPTAALDWMDHTPTAPLIRLTGSVY
eukprot:PhM_4_TR709/c0_g1_i1/m.52253